MNPPFTDSKIEIQHINPDLYPFKHCHDPKSDPLKEFIEEIDPSTGNTIKYRPKTVLSYLHELPPDKQKLFYPKDKLIDIEKKEKDIVPSMEQTENDRNLQTIKDQQKTIDALLAWATKQGFQPSAV